MKNNFDVNIHYVKIRFYHDFVLFNNLKKNNRHYILIIKIKMRIKIINRIKINVNINKRYFDILNFHNFEKNRNI